MSTRTQGLREVPRAKLMKYGPQDYVGATIAVRGTLYYKAAHAPAVREALCKCFDAYQDIAKDHLTWLWRDEPPTGSGPDKFAYRKAPALRSMDYKAKLLGEPKLTDKTVLPDML